MTIFKNIFLNFVVSKEWAHIRAGIVKIWRCEPHGIPFCRLYAQPALYQKYAIIASNATPFQSGNGRESRGHPLHPLSKPNQRTIRIPRQDQTENGLLRLLCGYSPEIDPHKII